MRLSPERLLEGERLACQAKIERGGQLVLRPVPVTEREPTADESVRDFRKDFAEMPLKRKFTTLVELEATAAFHTLSAVADFPFAASQGWNSCRFGRQIRAASSKRAPAEHRRPRPAPGCQKRTDLPACDKLCPGARADRVPREH